MFVSETFQWTILWWKWSLKRFLLVVELYGSNDWISIHPVALLHYGYWCHEDSSYVRCVFLAGINLCCQSELSKIVAWFDASINSHWNVGKKIALYYFSRRQRRCLWRWWWNAWWWLLHSNGRSPLSVYLHWTLFLQFSAIRVQINGLLAV